MDASDLENVNRQIIVYKSSASSPLRSAELNSIS